MFSHAIPFPYVIYFSSMPAIVLFILHSDYKCLPPLCYLYLEKCLCDYEIICYQVEALAVQLTQREGELIYEKAEVKKLANFLKQVCCIFLLVSN
jgi:hypothetical protein